MLLQHGPFGIEALRPRALFGADLPPLLHGVLWSLSLNILTYVVTVAGATAVGDRTSAGGPVRAANAGAERTDLPALALDGDGAGYPEHGRAISRARTRAPGIRCLCRPSPGQPRAVGAGRFRTAAACRAADRLLDRCGLLAARDVAVAAQARGLGQGGAEAARRFPCGGAFQPRDPADRAQSCAAGHCGVRCRFAADLLQPPVRRHPRAARPSGAARHSLAGNPGISSARSTRPATTTTRRNWRGASPPTPPRASPIWSGCPIATW